MQVVEILARWLILWPADLIAGLAVLPIGIAPFVATIAAWAWVVSVRDNTSEWRPANAMTFFLALAASLYVFAVTATAVYRIPYVITHIHSEDD